MSLAKKLNVKDGVKVHVVGKPAAVDLGDVVTTKSATAPAVLVFVKKLAALDDECADVIEAARQDRIAWVAYPKAGQLATDLNRDILRRQLATHGIDSVRAISLDDVWSAIRFRPES
ncbi:MAG TPA: hypothetical protein VH062_26735 [Polyangiaceae bacterium]|jgi:hypothetical protein|nr:hypothetical protein [Polyangiaceae bacterium]